MIIADIIFILIFVIMKNLYFEFDLLEQCFRNETHKCYYQSETKKDKYI